MTTIKGSQQVKEPSNPHNKTTPPKNYTPTKLIKPVITMLRKGIIALAKKRKDHKAEILRDKIQKLVKDKEELIHIGEGIQESVTKGQPNTNRNKQAQSDTDIDIHYLIGKKNDVEKFYQNIINKMKPSEDT